MRRLTDLLRAVPGAHCEGNPSNISIEAITSDSRQVKPGSLFVALKGEKTDGTQFIPDAIRLGAAAILIPSPHRGEASPLPNLPPMGEGTVVIDVPNIRLALSQLAAAFYEKQPEYIVAVTGTDGKTSTAEFTRQLFELLGHKAASIGTLGTIGQGGKILYPGTHTTPDPVSLHRMLAEMADNGYTHVAMEASSHGLDQYRLHGVRLKAAAFTNLTRDHMDYHKTEEAYFAAKAKLFTDFALKGAVINVNDPKAEELEAICLDKHISYTHYGQSKQRDPHADECFQIQNITPLPHGQKVVVVSMVKKQSALGKILGFSASEFQSQELIIPLVGTFQIYNMLAACGLALVVGAGKAEGIISLLPKLKGVPGRLEQVATLANGAAVYIDYAHTPAALANILKTLRPHTQNKLHVVFGCGGDRDKGKRPEMGKAASELADVAIVTDDNPRSEDPALIRAAVMEAAPRAKEVADRRQAIYAALKGLAAGDILVIAGKGHEKTQIVGDNTFPFDDAQVARDGIKELAL